MIKEAKKDSNWLKEAKWRAENRDWLNYSVQIAIKIVRHFREHEIDIDNLCNELGISPEVLSNILKGREDLTLSMIAKIEKSLGIKLL